MLGYAHTFGVLSSATMEASLEPLMGALNDKVAKIRKLAVMALSKVRAMGIAEVAMCHVGSGGGVGGPESGQS
eukprot:1145843-Pelagomonas_calceolata.AAC.9